MIAGMMPFLTIPFPHIDPVIFSLGPFAVRWYALAYVVGLLFAIWYMKKLVSTPSLWAGHTPTATPLEIDNLFMWIFCGVVVGGRVGYVVFYNFSQQLNDPLYVFKTLDGGMSFHGGFFGVIIAAFLYGKKHHIGLDKLLDLGAAATPVGLGLGRLGNFINGELYGRVTDVPWAMIFPGDESGLPRHPSQLYEFFLEGVLLFAVINYAIYRYKILARPGMAAGLFALIYGVSRILVETLREPDRQLGYYSGFLTMGMMLSVPLIMIGIWLIWRAQHKSGS